MEELNLSRKDNEFAARLIALRKRRNWSQQFVADKLGCGFFEGCLKIVI